MTGTSEKRDGVVYMNSILKPICHYVSDSKKSVIVNLFSRKILYH